MIFKSGNNLSSGLFEFIINSENIYVYVAYIKLNTLELLIESTDNVKAVFVRWEPRDLISGASDLEIYPFLRSKGISLYRNNRIHLKAYLDNFERCFLTSANISSRALNFPQFLNCNYEIGTIVEDLGFDDRLYFKVIESDSILITDNIYSQLIEQLPDKKKDFPNEEDFHFKVEAPDKDFLISSLPLTYSVETLYRIYELEEDVSDTVLNCALHDLALYKIPLGLSESEFRQKLSESFFSHKFIKDFLVNLEKNGEIYFGTAKDWIHKNCADAPLPRKWEITENTQVLYRWFVELGNGKYEVDRPNFSERLFVKQ